MQNNYKTRLIDGIVFAILAAIFYFYANYIYIGGFGVGYQYIGCMIIIAIGGVAFLVTPKLPEFIECMKGIGIMCLPYLVCIVVTLGIWIFTFTGIRQMISGFFAPVYILICVFCIGVVQYFLKKKAVAYVFWAMSIAFFIMIIQQMREVGVGEFFYEMYVLITSASTDTLPAMRVLEGPRFSYCYGLFFIYFLYHRKDTSKGRFFLRMMVCIFCFLVGFKRSCVLATIWGLVISLIYSRCGVFFKRKFVNILIVVFLIFAVAYIPIVRYGVFDRIVEVLNIDTSHRDELYDYYFDYYEFDPSFMGQGFGWVQNHIEGQEGLYAYDVHNEYLRNYIELGFWGYIFWILSVFPWVIKQAITNKDQRKDAVIAGGMVYMAILYITENIFLFYTFYMVLSVVIMSCRRDAIAGGKDELE